ncbi:MAG: ABC transporter permease [Lachnospiraceae bacterium]|nr:ABC transporter permease [Lachnospiraceae bacterium]
MEEKKTRSRKKKRIRPSDCYLGVLLALMYLPILMVILYSFNASKTSVVWGGFTLSWYEEMLHDRGLLQALQNSVVLGLSASAIAGVIGTLGAVGMSRVHFRSKGMLDYLILVPIMVPEIILGMVFMVFFSLLSLPFGMTTLVLGHSAFCVPYVYMMVKARLIGIDKSYAEAARDLGARERQVFFDITLPLIAPAIASGMLLSFAMSLDDVVISIFVAGARISTLPVKIYTQLKTGVTPEINALCTLMLAVTIFLVLLSGRLQKKKL